MCKETKALDDFNFHSVRKNVRHSWCKSCSKSYKREWDMKRTIDLKEYIYNLLSNSQCITCGEKDILVLEFDHREPSNKSFNISRATSGKDTTRVGLKELAKEIAKCDVMCRNCHQRKTHKENNSWKYLRVAKENTAV